MPVFAAVDIGANSVRLKIAELTRRKLNVVHEDREVTRLGESVFRNGAVSEQALKETCAVLARMAETYRKLDVVGVRAVVSGHRAIGSGLLVRLLERPTGLRAPESETFAGRLSPTELAILGMIGQAQSIPAIAANRGISHKTVRNHLAKIYRKLDLHGRTEAMLWAARMGLTGS